MQEAINKRPDSEFLNIKDLTVEYVSEGKIIHAVNGVTLQLDKGKTLGLVGETGAGKTTIAMAILRILSSYSSKITNGEVIFEGKNLLAMSETEMRSIRGEKISMVFQDPMTALNPIMRVGKQITEAIRYHEKISKKDAVNKAVKMMEMVGISADRFGDYPHQFSGGMKQRIVIAMALACNPDLLLADEPTTALDVTIQAQVLAMIRKLKEEKETSVILITHDLGIVAGNCDTVAIVYAGEIVEYGSKEEIFDHPSHPYTKGLFAALPDISREAARLTPIEGMPPNPSDLPKGCKFHPRCRYASEECSQKDVELKSIGSTHMCRCLFSGRKEDE